MRCQENIQKYAKHQIKKSSQQLRLSEDWSFSRILRGVKIAPQCSKEMGDPSQNGNVNRCIVSQLSKTGYGPTSLTFLHETYSFGFGSFSIQTLQQATSHLAYGRCPSEVAFFPPPRRTLHSQKLVARSPLRKKKKLWPSRRGWQASYYL